MKICLTRQIKKGKNPLKGGKLNGKKDFSNVSLGHDSIIFDDGL